MYTQADYDDNAAWGISTAIDLKDCDPGLIRDADAIRRFVYELCDLIKVTRFGECVVVNFGENETIAGYSMTQLIETSLISGHFVDSTNSVFLDVFSCKYYEPQVVADKAKEYFKASDATINVLLRK